MQDKISLKLVRGRLLPTEKDGEYILKPVPSADFPRFRSDVPANVLLYLPLGACLCWLLAARCRPAAAVAGATLIAAFMSYAIESAQLFETRRVASIADFACNTIGALAGAGLALAIARMRRRLQSSPFAGFLHHPVAAALLFSWMGYRLAPFAFEPHPDEWLNSLRPLEQFAFGPEAFLQHLIAWLVLLLAAGRLTPQRPVALVAGAIAVVLAGRVLMAGLALDPAEVAAMAAVLLQRLAVSGERTIDLDHPEIRG